MNRGAINLRVFSEHFKMRWKLALFCLWFMGGEFRPIILGELRAQDLGPGIIEGVDDYETYRYRSFDRGGRNSKRIQRPSRAQRQEADGAQGAALDDTRPTPENLNEETLPYWQIYRKDFDTYQEIQNEKFIQWQKRVGIRP